MKFTLPDKLFGKDSRLILLWLEPLAVGLVVIMSFLGLILPKFQLVMEKNDQIKEIKIKTKEVNDKIAYLMTMNEEVIKEQSDKLSQGLLPQRSAYLLLGVSRQVADQLGFYIDDFVISMMGDVTDLEGEAKSVKSRFDKLPINITMIGPKDKYLSLVKSLERTLPIISINSVDMTSVAGDSGSAKVQLNMSAYYLPEMNKPNIDKLNIADLTPNKKELELMSQIEEYQSLDVEKIEQGKTFTKYERSDPFFTP